jgi:hypothetical protein
MRSFALLPTCQNTKSGFEEEHYGEYGATCLVKQSRGAVKLIESVMTPLGSRSRRCIQCLE